MDLLSTSGGWGTRLERGCRKCPTLKGEDALMDWSDWAAHSSCGPSAGAAAPRGRGGQFRLDPKSQIGHELVNGNDSRTAVLRLIRSINEVV